MPIVANQRLFLATSGDVKRATHNQSIINAVGDVLAVVMTVRNEDHHGRTLLPGVLEFPQGKVD